MAGLTIASGGTLVPIQGRVLARTQIVVQSGGKIKNTAANGANGTAGATGAGGSGGYQFGSMGAPLGLGYNGGGGGGNGDADQVTGVGGSGGAGGGAGAGAGGASFYATAYMPRWQAFPFCLTTQVIDAKNSVARVLQGGGGGGGGGGTGGGGGGAGQYPMVLGAPVVTVQAGGAISNNGGNGGNGGNAGSGGGGGGGGGPILINSAGYTNSGTVTANGGSGGTGTAGNGTPGTAGPIEVCS